ncbi:dihydrolipoamide dehydrogenase [Natrinema saccharevitans]|uniref:Dihydrolipoamide dehydrogenase n=1 Tax=Natrinema saccharevitans TaxID=301967 RepID=A0A1S8B019_9EURY|nr:dihydrolipoyl dehydrogenase [Natrinema saccharevitans]OLZ42262.1 dihydrolipoamide dehydrogenase [Natrinema saccharevitans]
METYDIVVLGGGSGSQVATAAAERGLEAAVVEPGPLGGACITRGCVPSKALIHRADVIEAVRGAEAFGVDAQLNGVDYDGITDAIHETVFAKADGQEASMRDAANVTLYRGEGRFVDDRTVAVEPTDGGGIEEITGETIVIAVGGRPMVPPIDGLEDVAFRTSDDALFLDDRPDELVIVGGGYIGAELGYFFGALGTAVSIVGRSERLVPREDDDVSAAVTDSLEDHCDVYTGYEAAEVEPADERRDGEGIVVTAEPSDDGTAEAAVELAADDLLLATGRRPNTDTLALEETAVETDDEGYVETDGRLETGVDGVWALGDVIGRQPYKHAADYEARVVTWNVLDDADRTVDYGAMPHAIFTEPRVASVGRTEADLADAGREYEVATVSYDVAPLGMILEAGDGFVKALAGPDGEILGCHIVGPQAATLLHEVVYAAFDELSARAYSTAPDWRDVGDG